MLSVCLSLLTSARFGDREDVVVGTGVDQKVVGLKKYFLAIGAVFKDEALIIDEWINHYRRQGVDHFYLVNDHSKDDYNLSIGKHRRFVTLFHGKAHAQIASYSELIVPLARREAVWLGLVDLDEFAYTKKLNLRSMLQSIQTKDPQMGEVCAPWKLFGSSGWIKQPKNVVQSFTRRQNTSALPLAGLPWLTKCFLRTAAIDRITNPHSEYSC